MPNDLDHQTHILKILENFHGIEPLRKLFWTELNYDRENLPLPYQDTNNDLASEPVLWATQTTPFMSSTPSSTQTDCASQRNAA